MKFFLSVLTLLFIGLKLTNYIDWSWWLVLSPIWGTIILILFLAFLLQLYKMINPGYAIRCMMDEYADAVCSKKKKKYYYE